MDHPTLDCRRRRGNWTKLRLGHAVVPRRGGWPKHDTVHAQKTRTLSPGCSAVKYVPADVVALSLIVDDEVADRIGQLPALPVALPKGGPVTLILMR
jgi:hypothetical protein